MSFLSIDQMEVPGSRVSRTEKELDKMTKSENEEKNGKSE